MLGKVDINKDEPYTNKKVAVVTRPDRAPLFLSILLRK